MKKGITLTMEVYLEGDQDPAADFAVLATTTVRTQLQAAFSNKPQGLTLQIKNLQEQDSSDDDSDVALPPPLTTAPAASVQGSPATNATPAIPPSSVTPSKGRYTAARPDAHESQLPKLGTKYTPPPSKDGS